MIRCSARIFLVFALSLATFGPLMSAARGATDSAVTATDSTEVIGEFLLLLLGTPEGKHQAMDFIEARWEPGFTPMLLDVMRFNEDPALGIAIVDVLQTKTGQSLGFDSGLWLQWWWQQPDIVYEDYAEFRAALFGLVDVRFEAYFQQTNTATIRLDEVLWGGVKQDGIPPLRNPNMIPADQAAYLADTDIVFGLEINGDARAYPRRILGWHELFTDQVGGDNVAGVYCTLCGTMLLYRTGAGEEHHQLGTSGFLYRSNKLMYDQATQSLWSSIEGKPVVGPLAGKGIALERMAVVTTTWGEWRRRHPNTTVLDRDTGFPRDYTEGAAYRDYFATDELMFPVPVLDSRLRNKDEVLGLLLPQYPDQPLALAASYLAQNRLHQTRIGEVELVVLTDPSGANRVYERGEVNFLRWDGSSSLEDDRGVSWQLQESKLASSDGRVLHRLPAQRAFWFGWYSAYPHTRLVQ